MPHYADEVLSPDLWRHSAAELLATARLVEPAVRSFWVTVDEWAVDKTVPLPQHHLSRVYFMLIAYAVKNLLKAKLVETNDLRPLVERQAWLPNLMMGHALVRIARSAQSVFDADDELLLRRLQTCSVWFGRYPVPLSAQNPQTVTLSDGRRAPTTFFGGDDVES